MLLSYNRSQMRRSSKATSDGQMDHGQVRKPRISREKPVTWPDTAFGNLTGCAFVGRGSHAARYRRIGGIISQPAPPQIVGGLAPYALSRTSRTGRRHQQDREDACHEDAVESPGPADRSDRSVQAAHLIEVEKVGADQRPQAAGNVGQGRRLA